jgi:hypothetical protein
MLQAHSPVRPLLEEQQKQGGFLCIADKTGRPLVIHALGSPTAEKWDACLAFCEEKVRRLGMNPTHQRSWQSRNPEQLQYGGAVRGEDFIVSFSGFPEELDEVIAGMALYEGADLSEVADLARILEDNSFVVAYGADWLSSLC